MVLPDIFSQAINKPHTESLHVSTTAQKQLQHAHTVYMYMYPYIHNVHAWYTIVAGLTSTTIPMYIAEASPTYARGRLVSTNIVMVACGQFVANVVDGAFSFEPQGWR